MSKFVRLKRFNGKQHVLRRYTVFGIKFEESKGWYEVDDDVAAYLEKIKQREGSPDSEFSADAFDVCDTLEEAMGIDEAEKKKAERKLAEDAERVRRPQAVQARGAGRRSGTGDLTTADLNEPIRPKKGDGFDDQDDTFPEDGKPLNEERAPTPAKTIETADEDEGGEAPKEPSPPPKKRR